MGERNPVTIPVKHTHMKTEHTKGPWRTEGWENLVVNSADGQTMTLAAGGKDASLDELKANARLIAAAPELLAALKAIADYVAVMHGHRGGDILQYAIAAINKAEGRA